MKNYTLVIVAAKNIVVREYTAHEHNALIKEVEWCQKFLRQTLVFTDNSVVFESIRGQHNILSQSVITDMLSHPKEIRVLTEREILAIERAHYRAN